MLQNNLEAMIDGVFPFTEGSGILDIHSAFIDVANEAGKDIIYKIRFNASNNS